MNIKHPFIAEILTVIALVAAPFVLPHLGFSLTTVNRILIWGLFGLGFDLLFGYIGLLSFGQSAFFGTGGMFAAYLLTEADFPYVLTSIVIGAGVAGLVGYLVGLIALRRTGIYFAMIQPWLHEAELRHRPVDVCLPRVLVFRRPGRCAAHCTLPGGSHLPCAPRQPSARLGSRSQHSRLQAHGLRRRGRLCRLCWRPARRHARLHAAGCVHVRHIRPTRDADRHRRRGHAVRAARWSNRMALSKRLSPECAASWRDLEARARPCVRAACLLPETWNCRCHHRSLSVGSGP